MAEAVEMPPETKEEIINAPKLAFIPVYQRCTGSVDDEHMETFQKKAGLSTEDVQVMKGIIEDGFQYFVCIRCLALQCFSMAPLLGGGAAMIARFMTHDFTIPIIIGISSLVTLFIGSILGLIWWVNKHETGLQEVRGSL